MSDPVANSTQLQNLLDLLRDGDDAARKELINRACTRLRLLARKMFRSYPDVARWEQTDDVLQSAVLKLYQSLAKVKPESVRGFFGLAATHIRRELLDLARHHLGPEGHGAHHASDGGQAHLSTSGHIPLHERAADTEEPKSLADWSAFHEQVELLPEKEREIVHLLFYQEMTQAEAAVVLAVSERTVKRHWQSARLLLQIALAAD